MQKKILLSGPMPPPLGGMQTYCKEYLNTKIPELYSITFCECLLIKSVGNKSGIVDFMLRVLNRIITMVVWLVQLALKRPQIAHVHTNSGPGFFVRGWMTKVARRMGAHSILHMHGAAFKEYYWGLSNRRKKHALRCLHANSRLMVLSEAWKEFFISIGVSPQKIVVMENSVVVPRLESKRKKENKLTALYLSRIERRKGVFEIIEAIDANRQLLDDYHFIIAGPLSDDYWEIESLLDKRGLSSFVEMPGPLIEGAKDSVYRRADVYLLQSYAEGMPIGLLEAMSYGLACISSPVGGIPEVIEHNKNGLLIPPGDSKQLAISLTQLSSDAKLRESLGRFARQSMERSYSWDAREQQLISFYESMLDSSKKAGVSDVI